MGITGLLPFLDKAKTEINVKMLNNKTVAIDTYCWLHKGAFGVGDKIARGEKTDIHIKYCLKFVYMLLSHNIKPILVFDGRHLPAKAETEAKRRERRKADKQKAVELMRKGRHSEASKYLRRCVDITHEMAHELIEQCRSINVDCIVAPYEADAQLAYLNKIGLADYVITEDSDLTLFGCTKILFKLDLTGACVLVESDKFHLAMNCAEDKFSMEKFRLMCVLSGCDYVDSLPGIGLAKACKFVMMTEETNIWRALDKIPAYLNMRQLTVTDDYKLNVLKAIATFLHMVVYDPRQRKQVRLNDINELGTETEYCSNSGELLDDTISLDLAVGNLNPFGMARLGSWHPDKRHKKSSTDIKTTKATKHPSIWQQDYRWTISVPSKDTRKAFDTTAVRRSKRSISATENIDEVDEGGEDTSNKLDEDLFNQYASLAEPQLKRFKDDDVPEEKNTNTLKSPPTPKRNPFKTSNPCTNELLSPTRISKDNNSLLKNQSPVKRIDYDKLRKLSRFDRTAGSSNQQTLSHFFNAEKSPTIEQCAEKRLATHVPEETETPDLYFHTEKGNVENVYIIPSKIAEVENSNEPTDVNPFTVLNNFLFNGKNRMESDDSAVCFSQTSCTTNRSNSEFNSDIDSLATDETPIEIISDSSNDVDDKIERVENPIVLISDDENDNMENKSTAKKSISGFSNKKKTAAGCRKVGLRSKAIKSSSSAQMRLSMFGFQAKPKAS